MKSLFNRWLPCLTLGAWSAAIFTVTFNRQLLGEILAGEFRIYALVAGCVLMAGSLVFLLFPVDVNCCSFAECGHGLSRRSTGKILSFLVLILPVNMAFWASPDALSKIQMENRMAITAPPPGETNFDDYLKRNSEGTIEAQIMDLLWAAQDRELRPDFENKKVKLMGQLMPDSSSNPTGKRFKLVRMMMVCCAADARPITALVETVKPIAFPEMTWITVSGTATFPIEKGKHVPVIKADIVEKADPPAESMIY